MEKDKKLANNPTMDDDYLFSASCQDCTGLIPSIARDEAEVESYENLYPYLPPVPPPEVGAPSTTPVPEVGIPTAAPEPEVLPITSKIPTI